MPPRRNPALQQPPTDDDDLFESGGGNAQESDAAETDAAETDAISADEDGDNEQDNLANQAAPIQFTQRFDILAFMNLMQLLIGTFSIACVNYRTW
ncbi:hypothetical protein GGI19_002878 [Coemansia pectinata]|uniref:Uncharacterized protein n=1 Tax=Coemansia pectinata TaxID=1052879 RepID=A0A9W8L9W3_9FUNG|nr:hypothetical protein GGI19_002878 [Coemansia pectinata]